MTIGKSLYVRIFFFFLFSTKSNCRPEYSDIGEELPIMMDHIRHFLSFSANFSERCSRNYATLKRYPQDN